MCGKPMLSPAVAAMRRSGRSHSGRLRVGRFARSMGSNGFWAGRAGRCGWHPWDLTACGRGCLMDARVYELSCLEAALEKKFE